MEVRGLCNQALEPQSETVTPATNGHTNGHFKFTLRAKKNVAPPANIVRNIVSILFHYRVPIFSKNPNENN